MRIGLTYDLREDYNIDSKSDVFADFCHPDEIGYLADAIRALGHEPVLLGNMYKLNYAIKRGTFDCDLVFVEDEGIMSRNREILVPALLELNGIPYVGSDAYAMGLSQNKSHTKLVARSLGIRVPDELYISPDQPGLRGHLEREMARLGLSFPLVVKPNAEGYSMGVFLVRTLDEAVEKLKYNFDHYKQPALCEQYIQGAELYVPMVGTGADARCLGVGVCRHRDGRDIDIFTLKDKCFTPMLDQIADVPDALRQELFDASLTLHRHLECRDFSRTDFKLTADGTAYLLEINPRPGLTQNGPYETCARALGLSYPQIIGQIIDSAVQRVPSLRDTQRGKPN